MSCYSVLFRRLWRWHHRGLKKCTWDYCDVMTAIPTDWTQLHCSRSAMFKVVNILHVQQAGHIATSNVADLLHRQSSSAFMHLYTLAGVWKSRHYSAFPLPHCCVCVRAQSAISQVIHPLSKISSSPRAAVTPALAVPADRCGNLHDVPSTVSEPCTISWYSALLLRHHHQHVSSITTEWQSDLLRGTKFTMS